LVLAVLRKHQTAQETLETIQFLHRSHLSAVAVVGHRARLDLRQEFPAAQAVARVVMVVRFLAVAVLLIKVLLAVQALGQTAQAVAVEQVQQVQGMQILAVDKAAQA
jgi:hypothetical protein